MNYSCYLDDLIRFNEELVLEKLKNFKPLKYNKFYWWRMYDDNHNPLSNKSPLEKRIKNGDFNEPSYKWQAQLALLIARKKLDLSKDNYTTQMEKTSIDLSRYRKLMDDHYKEEQKRLDDLKKSFLQSFQIQEDILDDYLIKWGGDILSLYNMFKSSIRTTPKENRKINK